MKATTNYFPGAICFLNLSNETIFENLTERYSQVPKGVKRLQGQIFGSDKTSQIRVVNYSNGSCPGENFITVPLVYKEFKTLVLHISLHVLSLRKVLEYF